MTATKKMKTSDRQGVVQQILNLLKKKYKPALPKWNWPVLESLLFSVLLEDSPQTEAEVAFEKLLKAFHDLNEIRVSSVHEIEQAIHGLNESEWKAMRFRDVLQLTFDTFYAFDMESFKRKPQDALEKHLAKLHYGTTFTIDQVLHHCLQLHVVPLDACQRNVLAWLGLADQKVAPRVAGEDLKQVVRKADVPLFTHLLRCAATDSHFRAVFEKETGPSYEEADPASAAHRLQELLDGKNRKPPQKLTPKPASKSSDSITGKLQGSDKPSTSQPAPLPALGDKAQAAKKLAESQGEKYPPTPVKTETVQKPPQTTKSAFPAKPLVVQKPAVLPTVGHGHDSKAADKLHSEKNGAKLPTKVVPTAKAPTPVVKPAVNNKAPAVVHKPTAPVTPTKPVAKPAKKPLAKSAPVTKTVKKPAPTPPGGTRKTAATAAAKKVPAQKVAHPKPGKGKVVPKPAAAKPGAGKSGAAAHRKSK